MRTEVEILVPRASEGLFNRKRRSPAENQLSFMNVGHLALEEELFPSLTSDVTVKQSDKDRRKWPQQTRPMVRRAANQEVDEVIDAD